jgi:hypothetical protein
MLRTGSQLMITPVRRQGPPPPEPLLVQHTRSNRRYHHSDYGLARRTDHRKIAYLDWEEERQVVEEAEMKLLSESHTKRWPVIGP